jgi:MFS family permease
MFAALSVRNFRRYMSGQALSLIGAWVETVAQALLVLRLTHSGVILGLTTAARFAPVLLLSPYAGLLVDRFAKRRVLLITQAGLGLVSLALGILVLSGHAGLGQIVVLALAFGTFSAVDNPARPSLGRVETESSGPVVTARIEIADPPRHAGQDFLALLAAAACGDIMSIPGPGSSCWPPANAPASGPPRPKPSSRRRKRRSPAGQPGGQQPGHRRAAVPEPFHRRLPPAEGLPEDRRDLPHPARPRHDR